MTLQLEERIHKLSAAQQKLLTHQLSQLAGANDGSKNTSQAQIIAYVQGDVSELKTFVKSRLPEYMVPNTFLEVEEFPRLPNGKLDNLALKDLYKASKIKKAKTNLNSQEENSSTAKKLIAIWEEVLNFSPISVQDNFFEIGGDSILSIQIIAKARKQGMTLAPNQIFEHQTIAELALFVTSTTDPKKLLLEDSADNIFTLSPIQHWFFEKHKIAPHFWNQGFLWTPNFELAAAKVKKATNQLVEQYDALRLAFKFDEHQWTGSVCEIEQISAFEHVTIDNTAQINTTLKEVQSKFDLQQSKLFKCIYFDVASQAQPIIAFIAHHLLLDNVSLTILLEDLIRYSKEDKSNHQEEPTIDQRADYISNKKWTQHLLTNTKNGFFDSELTFWKKQIENNTAIPTDFEASLPIYESEVVQINAALPLGEKLSSSEIHSTYQTKQEDLILTALVSTISNWTDLEKVCFGLELHGRESINGFAPSQTVGWLTSYFPLSFTADKSANWGAKIKSVKETLRGVPNGGIGFGALRYLAKENLAHQPQIVFNYLGNKSNQSNGNHGAIKIIDTALRHAKSERNYLLEINAYIIKETLHVNWSFGKSFYQYDTIETLQKEFTKHLASIFDHCIENNEINYTPSDFPESGLNQSELDNLMDLLG